MPVRKKNIKNLPIVTTIYFNVRKIVSYGLYIIEFYGVGLLQMNVTGRACRLEFDFNLGVESPPLILNRVQHKKGEIGGCSLNCRKFTMDTPLYLSAGRRKTIRIITI